MDNPLPREPLRPEHVTPGCSGTGGTTPGGPGRGGPGPVASALLEGTRREVHPDITRDAGIDPRGRMGLAAAAVRTVVVSAREDLEIRREVLAVLT